MVHKIIILVDLGHHKYILSLADLYLGVEKKIFNELMQFYYMTYGHALAQDPLPRGF